MGGVDRSLAWRVLVTFQIIICKSYEKDLILSFQSFFPLGRELDELRDSSVILRWFWDVQKDIVR